MRTGWIAVASVVLACCAALPDVASAQRVIKPMRTPDDLRLSPAAAWIGASKLPGQDGTLANLSYVAGFFDAVALFESNALKIKEVSAALDGMDLEQVTESVTKFYQDNPQWRDFLPAVVIIGVLPRIRKGLPPVPPVGSSRD